MRRLFFSIPLLLASSWGFAAWDQQTLEQSAQVARQSIDQLSDGRGPLLKMIGNRSTANDIIQKMRFKEGEAHDFAHLTNKREILKEITSELYYSNRDNLGYFYLASQYSPQHSSDQTEYLMDVYEAILADSQYKEDGSSQFAFNQLYAIESRFDDSQENRMNRIMRSYGFRLSDVDVDRYQEKPEICLRFNQSVRPEPVQDWAEKIQFMPAIESKGMYRNQQICYRGKWQQRYEISIDSTLEARYTRLQIGANETQVINTENREPTFNLSSRGKTLNLSDAGNLEIQSANMAKINLELWQIPANNLANQELRNAIESPARFYARNQALLEDNLRLIYRGHFLVEDQTPNATVSTNIRFADMLGNAPKQPGVYVLIARDPEDRYYNEPQTLGFTVSNTGVSAYSTPAGLWLEVRDLTTAEPVSGKTFTLYAYNNRELGQARSNRDGIVHFPEPQINGEAGERPSHVISFDDDELTYLGIRDSGYDLSDKGLSGTPPDPVLTTWSWTDRGVYRPNDKANVLWLLRKPDGTPYHEGPLWLKVLRPDGSLMQEQAITADSSGSYLYTQPFDRLSRLGNWQLQLSLGEKGPVITTTSLLVAAITPQQIETALSVEQPPQADTPYPVILKADWLYGAPADGMPVTGAWTLDSDPSAFGQWPGWQIGDYDESFTPVEETLAAVTTDPQGLASITLTPPHKLSTRPQKLFLKTALLAPDGNEVEGKLSRLLSRAAPYALLKKTGNTVEVMLVDDQGKPVSGNLHWAVQRLDYDYYWFYSGGQWSYQNNTSRSEVLYSGRCRSAPIRVRKFRCRWRPTTGRIMSSASKANSQKRPPVCSPAIRAGRSGEISAPHASPSPPTRPNTPPAKRCVCILTRLLMGPAACISLRTALSTATASLSKTAVPILH